MANNLDDQTRAIELLTQALAIDSTFAMAHRKLAIVSGTRWKPRSMPTKRSSTNTRPTGSV